MARNENGPATGNAAVMTARIIDARFSTALLNEIRSRVSLAELVAGTVELRRRAANSWAAARFMKIDRLPSPS